MLIEFILDLRLHVVVDGLLEVLRLILRLREMTLTTLTPLAPGLSARRLWLTGPGAWRASRRSRRCWRVDLDVVDGYDGRLDACDCNGLASTTGHCNLEIDLVAVNHSERSYIR